MTETRDDKVAFGGALKALGLIFGQAVDRPLMKAYFEVLQPLPLDAFLGAADAAKRELKWFPKPAELLDLAGAGESARKAARSAAIAAAWEAVRGAMDRYDYTHSVDFGMTVNAVVRNLGGWEALCARSLRDLIYERKRFEALLDVYLLCPPRELRGEPLPGRFGGEPVRIAIAGRMPPLQIAAADAGVSPLVRQLAESKAL